MGRTVPKTRAGERWTEAKYFGFIRSGLRRMSMRWPVKHDVMEAARRAKPKSKAGRHRFEYKCAGCKKWFKGADVAVDHITPAGTLKSFDDLPGFVERLFCEADNLQVLCNTCHDKKTKEERA